VRKKRKTITVDEGTYKLLREQKEKFNLTYDELLRKLIEATALELEELHPEVEVVVKPPDNFPKTIEVSLPVNLPEAGIILPEPLEKELKVYAAKRRISLNRAVVELLSLSLQFQGKSYILISDETEEKIRNLLEKLSADKRENFKKELQKIVTFYIKKLISKYKKKIKL
jgi:predicted HicB family RNase H-like nuclease